MTATLPTPPTRRSLAVAAAAIAASCALAVGLFAAAVGVMAPPEDHAAAPRTLDAAAREPAALLGLALEQVYRAFGETEEAAIYDALAKVAAGEALTTLYLQKRDAIVNAAVDAGAQRIDHIDVTAAEAKVLGQRLSIAGRWRVIGAVGHEDHQHVRGALYTADVDFALRPEGWRMVAFTLRDIDRTDLGEPLGP